MEERSQFSIQINVSLPKLGIGASVRNARRSFLMLALIAIAGLLIVQRAGASSNRLSNSPIAAHTFNYQGHLADATGTVLSGHYNMSFTLFDEVEGGNIVWGPEAHSAVPVQNGVFHVAIGSLTDGGVPATIWGAQRYIEIVVDGEAMSPRELVQAVPIAQTALTVVNGGVTQAQAPFAPEVTYDGKWTDLAPITQPKIHIGWFQSGADGMEAHDLSDVFSSVYAVHVTKTRGSNTPVNYRVTDAAGTSTPTPAEVVIHAYNDDGGYLSWEEGMFIVIGR